ncbi:sulfur oxidation c-type cytochrome SoxA [Yoonia sp.]|uniref:sulfur oxidation c-type cytochrome SoxA n=1 Tax=Yoonia sp. TaxID=2212373 RepID=UPI003F6B7B2B
MKTFIKAGAAAIALFAAGAVQADEDANLIINEEIEITVRTDAPEHVDGLRTIYSGWVFRSDETQALQMDDFENPGMIFADDARDAWNIAEGSEGKSCADCHGDPDSLADARGTFPKWNDEAEEVRTLAMQVNGCRTEQMGAEAWKYDGTEMLNMEALLASVARGNPVNVAIDGPVAATYELGKELYYTRTGQLDLSCANCHEDNYGNNIRADHLSQGQINGFPTYRLKNAKLNGVQSRFRGCIRDTRAETYAVGSEEFIALELYVASRGNGLSVEGPSVRN